MRRFHSHAVACLVIIGALFQCAVSAPRRPMTFGDVIKIKRVADPQLSPDGKWIAYAVTQYDMEKNSRQTNIWLIPANGGEPRRLTASEKVDSSPRWSPDSRKVAFISNRDGSSQVWVIDVGGGEARRITKMATEAGGVIWSGDGKHLAFTSNVYADCTTDDCNQKRNEAREKSKVKAQVFDHLLYRHWSTFKEGKRTHIFVVPAEGGEARDLTPGDFDSPPFSLGGPTDYALSPDGKELCFTQNSDKVEAASTNSDLFIVPITGGTARRITTNPGADASPLYSPDGRFIAFRAQARAGYESDQWQLMLYDRQNGHTWSLTAGLDRPVDEFRWTADSQRLYFTAVDEGYHSIYMVSTKGNDHKKISNRSSNGDVQPTPDGRSLIFSRRSMTQPAEIFRSTATGDSVQQLTHTNDALLAVLDFQPSEYVWYKGAGGAPVQAWIVKPPRFDASKKYPFILLIHGGPQGAWDDGFSYRWNPQLFAAAGYVVMAPNPRGSTGFGQQFTDEINADWGGRVYEDLMKGVDYAESLGYVDRERMGAAGGSYGGYMVDWIAGHTDRFKALITHAGVYNLTSMYGVTEELWFPEWEFRGVPWTNKAVYEKWSPHNFVANFKTPTLVIHGELDYRVPVAEGFQMFTALQRMNVPSKMLYFPDEGHWILKPQNSELWHKTFIEWFDTYLKPRS
ncbi:MAG: S9 family peptidase [Acidobacteria bacterium]|nr:S9 family peptidase [Acidobacteriota bacterium]